MSYPSVRQQDEFFERLGLDPFRNNVEIVTVHDYQDKPMTVMYCFERDGETRIATHWLDDNSDIT